MRYYLILTMMEWSTQACLIRLLGSKCMYVGANCATRAWQSARFHVENILYRSTGQIYSKNPLLQFRDVRNISSSTTFKHQKDTSKAWLQPRDQTNIPYLLHHQLQYSQYTINVKEPLPSVTYAQIHQARRYMSSTYIRTYVHTYMCMTYTVPATSSYVQHRLSWYTVICTHTLDYL